MNTNTAGSVRVFEREVGEGRTAARGPRIFGGCPPWTSLRLNDDLARSCPDVLSGWMSFRSVTL